MKKILFKTILFMFLCMIFLCFSFFKIILHKDNFYYNAKNAKVLSFYDKTYKIDNKYIINLKIQNYNYSISLQGINCKTKLQKEILNTGLEKRKETLLFCINNGFSLEEGITYTFPEIVEELNRLEKQFNYKPINSELRAISNTGKIYLSTSKKGFNLDKKGFYNNFFNKIKNNFNIKELKMQFLEIECEKDEKYYSNCMDLKGSYQTSFKSSSESRKNNISRALSCFDGKVIKPGESISFNDTTGYRTEDNGYMKAKTIRNGSFYEEFGGGVCQVSTTLYNAALIAGLDIKEVHPHSLPVGYVDLCFDAMVNSGSSDLVISNNTNKPVIIATSNINDVCLVNIYGIKNEYEIKRKSKKISSIDTYEKEIISDYKMVGLDKPLNKGEVKIISNGKFGCTASGYLEYFKDGVLIKTKKIRTNTYNPTKEVILVSE